MTPLEGPLTELENEQKTVMERIRARRYFPLSWGLASLALMATFAVITLVGFNRINSDKIAEAQRDQYESDLRAYEAAVDVHDRCVETIGVRETYRGLFKSIEIMFQTTGDLPVELFPDSAIAKAYRDAIYADAKALIADRVEQDLPPRTVEECPLLPTEIPKEP